MPSVYRPLAVALLTSLGLLAARGPAAALDVNEDLVRRYAPELHLCTYGTDGSGEGKDWTRPADIDWYLNTGAQVNGQTVGAAMRFNQDNCPDDGIASAGQLNRSNVGSTQWKDQKKGFLCVKSGDYYHANQKSPSPDETKAYFFLQPRVGSGDGVDYDKVHHGIYGGANGANPTLFATDGAGESITSLLNKGIDPQAAPPVGKWVMYVYVLTPSRFGGAADIQYWFFYAYNDAAASVNHESDWERVTVTVNDQGQVISLFLAEHEQGTQFVPDDTSRCSGGFISKLTMRQNGTSARVCLDFTNEDSGMHPIVYSADGTHATYPSGCATQCTWNGYAGGITSDYTTAAGPAWKGWLTSSSAKNYEIVSDNTSWILYANLWGEVGATNTTSGKYSPKYQDWGKHNDDNPYGPK
ncbi:MAG TPA: hypothetical protein VEW48_20985 [Thermoanaerobaculia bacterium]|nr:hypothetical protein [Thermoanaerobaculia bacterium]